MTPDRAESAIARSPVLITWMAVFRPCFTAPVWNHILVLVAGAVLAPGKRTVTQTLRVMGLADQPGFGRYHVARNRVRWDARDVARRLLLHLLAVLVPSGEASLHPADLSVGSDLRESAKNKRIHEDLPRDLRYLCEFYSSISILSRDRHRSTLL